MTLTGLGGPINVKLDSRGVLVLTGQADPTPAGHGFAAHLEGIGTAVATPGQWPGTGFVLNDDAASTNRFEVWLRIPHLHEEDPPLPADPVDPAEQLGVHGEPPHPRASRRDPAI